MEEVKYWLWLTMVFGAGNIRLWEALEHFETPQEAYEKLSADDDSIRLKDTEKRSAKSRILYAENMESAVELAFENTPEGKICLLSPAASSYNVYKNFEEKGKHYKTLINGYSKKEG